MEESATDFLQCSGQDYNNVQWNDLSQDTQQPVLQNTSPGAASSDSCDTATVAGGKKRKGASGASSATQNHASTDQEQKRKVSLKTVLDYILIKRLCPQDRFILLNSDSSREEPTERP